MRRGGEQSVYPHGYTDGALNNVSPVTTLTNGIPLLNQRIGGNSQYAATTNGMTNQWNFYVFTNTASLTNTTFTMWRFLTFSRPTLACPGWEHSGEINPGDTAATRNAEQTSICMFNRSRFDQPGFCVIATASRSVGRVGDEVVVFTNSAPGQVVLHRHQVGGPEGAQYGFAGIASNIPFDQTDTNGMPL